MKILTISDDECPALWEFYQPGRLAEYDLIIACGDLNAKYLSFLVTMARCPLLYVPGNHDVNYNQVPPEGCDCIDGHIVTYNGVRIMGLGGCRRYRPGAHQYTESQMRRRIRKLRYKLWRLKGVDIVVTHAAPKDLGDAAEKVVDKVGDAVEDAKETLREKVAEIKETVETAYEQTRDFLTDIFGSYTFFGW